jgi:hypothetical protein
MNLYVNHSDQFLIFNIKNKKFNQKLENNQRPLEATAITSKAARNDFTFSCYLSSIQISFKNSQKINYSIKKAENEYQFCQI